jgi:competence protein ComEC
MLARFEAVLDRERDQLPLWLPVALGAGIAAWFALPQVGHWIGVIAAGLAIGFAGLALVPGVRIARALAWGGFLVATGCALIWWRAEASNPRPITRAMTVEFTAIVERVEPKPAEDKARLLLRPVDSQDLPSRVRVSMPIADVSVQLTKGARIKLRARLMPPGEPPVPGGYDFSRTAWFTGLGATGRVLGTVTVEQVGEASSGLRERLSAHVRSQLPGSAGGIAAAFATGDRGGIDEADEEAMRASGLTHLLSISGLHITAVVGAAMILALRLLALSPWLALRARLPVWAALAGAAAGIGYTVLTGAEVPTIRSCIAALLILFALAIGREALTLRLVATGALVVLLVLPESLAGPSFQLSFAAITAIVALHEVPLVKRLTLAREDGVFARFGRSLLALLLTGIAVEAALAPIALYHFHKSGLYGALANIVAIPLTTFVIMPAGALALIFDAVGLGAPFWWGTGHALAALLALARMVADAPGAMAAMPAMPVWAFALMIAGGLWLLLWIGWIRWWGLIPFAVGAVAALMQPAPDLLITGDGRHLALRGDGRGIILRERTGDYVRDVMAEQLGTLEEATLLDGARGAQCNRDLCTVSVKRNGRSWRIAATRSGYRLDWEAMIAVCRDADIVVSDRMLPKGCQPRWIKADPSLLRTTGGLAITLAPPAIRTVRQADDDHPWAVAARSVPQYRRRSPASRP